MAAKPEFDGSQVVRTKDFVLFWQPPAVFGQWTNSPFVVDGVTYSCAEQFMMAQKALLFDDQTTLKKIMDARSPKQHKALGKMVSPFVQEVWDSNCLDIVIRGNLAKFSQNPEMKEALLSTGERTLVEASPYDRVWGVGLRADDARIYDPKSWRGQNLLGKALMEVRSRLRER